MLMRVALMALAVALAGCERQAEAPQGGEAPSAQLGSPAPAADPSRTFQPVNEAARPFGALSVAMATRLPDDPGAEATDVITLTGANGHVIEGAITSAISPSTQVQGQTLRALLNIPVEEASVLVYRVTNETRPEGRPGICGADTPTFVVVWEPNGPGDPVIKVLGVMGAAPGAAGARPCPMLEYRRS